MKVVRTALTCAALCLLLLPSVHAQVAGPGSSHTAALAPPFAAVRAAWNASEDEALALVAAPGMTLQEFTVLCVVAHDSGRSLNELSALRRSGKSWSQVIKDLKGPLWDILLHGSARYRLKPVEPPEAGPETEQEILRLAQVMTLERLTGRGPAAIQRELDEGRDYAQLLAPNEGKSQPASVPSHNRHGRGKGWPPGLGDPGTPPASSGIIDSGGGRPSGR